MDQIPLYESDLPNFKLISRGKVRDLYEISSEPDHLLFVASDRISAFDVVLRNGIPGKGAVLTRLSEFWFSKLRDIVPNHLVTSSIDSMPACVQQHRNVLEGRVMLVQKAKVVPLEAIVRGYLTGSAWVEYKRTGTVHGIPVAKGLVESQALPEPLFTPSTKAEQGCHDENISPAQAKNLVGEALYDQISMISLALYETAAKYAKARGIILADTKFEFGLLPSSSASSSQQLILIDECLTPDSSRYWPLASYAPGGPQKSFDKQFLRDWLIQAGFKKGLEKGKDGEGWTMSEDVVEGTKARFEEAARILMT